MSVCDKSTTYDYPLLTFRNDANDGGLLQSMHRRRRNDPCSRTITLLFAVHMATMSQFTATRPSHISSTERLKCCSLQVGHLSSDGSLSRRDDSIAIASGTASSENELGLTSIYNYANCSKNDMPYFIKVKIVALGDVALCCK